MVVHVNASPGAASAMDAPNRGASSRLIDARLAPAPVRDARFCRGKGAEARLRHETPARLASVSSTATLGPPRPPPGADPATAAAS